MELPTPQSLKNRRVELGLTQSELGIRAGVSQPLIARIEGGEVDPRLSTLRKIVIAMDEKSGSLVRAEVLMHSDVISISPTDTVQATVKRMQDTGYSQLPVIQDGSSVGSISDSNIIQSHAKYVDIGDLPVSEIMGESFPTVGKNSTLDEISNLLYHYKAIVVMDSGSTVGIITQADVAAYLGTDTSP
tara:strand:+ start:4276 stop:4839 length:564 start_codon:yes stop_codon:yes gene_type:complete